MLVQACSAFWVLPQVLAATAGSQAWHHAFLSQWPAFPEVWASLNAWSFNLFLSQWIEQKDRGYYKKFQHRPNRRSRRTEKNNELTIDNNNNKTHFIIKKSPFVYKEATKPREWKLKTKPSWKTRKITKTLSDRKNGGPNVRFLLNNLGKQQ